MKIALDIDGVLLDFHGPFIAFYNSMHGTTFSIEDITSYDFSSMAQQDKDKFQRAMQEFHHEENFRDFPTLPGVQEAMRILSGRYFLGAITSRRDYLYEATLYSLRKGLLLEFISEVHFTNGYSEKNRREKKSDICSRHGYEVIIEDCAEYAEECAEAGIPAILLTKPWNSQQKLHPNIQRVSNWTEILQHLK